jgi:glycosyltransferase involved in cell wall biosynthesis
MILIFIPVYNEELILESNIKRLKEFVDKNLKRRYRVIIVDGNSTDKTPEIGKELAKKYKQISYINTKVKGKGAQLKKAVLSFKGKHFIFLDADLPIRLEEFLEIINNLLREEADLVIASRHIAKRKIERPLLRKIASKLYSVAIKNFLRIPVSDTIAGCKAWNKKVQEKIWPRIKDKRFFFDTELIYYTYKEGLKVKQIPVSYFDRKKGSKFSVFRDGFYIARNLIKLRFKE